MGYRQTSHLTSLSPQLLSTFLPFPVLLWGDRCSVLALLHPLLLSSSCSLTLRRLTCVLDHSATRLSCPLPSLDPDLVPPPGCARHLPFRHGPLCAHFSAAPLPSSHSRLVRSVGASQPSLGSLPLWHSVCLQAQVSIPGIWSAGRLDALGALWGWYCPAPAACFARSASGRSVWLALPPPHLLLSF